MAKTLEEKLDWKNLPWYKRIFQPNKISVLSVPVTVLGMYMMGNSEYNMDIAGIFVMSGGYLMDALDGNLSRKWEMSTKEGAKLDPAMDKVKNLLVGGKLMANEASQGNYFLPLAVGMNFAVDITSQLHRNYTTKTSLIESIRETYRAVVHPEKCTIDKEENSVIRAHSLGKAKTWVQAVPSVGYFALEALKNRGIEFPTIIDDIPYAVIGSTLCVAAGLGTAGLIIRTNGNSKKKE